MYQALAEAYAYLASGEPLGQEFERVWEDNVEVLLEV